MIRVAGIGMCLLQLSKIVLQSGVMKLSVTSREFAADRSVEHERLLILII